MSGHRYQKISLQVIDNQSLRILLEWLFSFGCGMMAYAFQGILKNPIGIPGHHGLMFMAFLLLAKTATRNRASGVASSLGVSFIILMGPMGFSDPFRMVTYMLPGIALDAIMLPESRMKGKWFRAILPAVAGGIAYMMIPLFRIIMMGITGVPYPGAIKYGVALTLLSFLLFGLAGSAAGWTMQRISRPIFKK